MTGKKRKNAVICLSSSESEEEEEEHSGVDDEETSSQSCSDDGSDWNYEEETGSESLEDGDSNEDEEEEEEDEKSLDDGDDDERGSESTKPLDIEATCNRVIQLLKGGSGLQELKLEECKGYLRKLGLRLSGTKAVCIQRIQDHWRMKDGKGEKLYPRSSFVITCTGDVCRGDVVLFSQRVYERYDKVTRNGNLLGKRTIAGRVVKESYGAAKQQHTFTVEIFWSKGFKSLPLLFPLLVKGRNLYRMRTFRQQWDDEEERSRVLAEKHRRGAAARHLRAMNMARSANPGSKHRKQSHRAKSPKRKKIQEFVPSTKTERHSINSRGKAPLLELAKTKRIAKARIPKSSLTNLEDKVPEFHANTQNVDPQAQYWSQSYTQNVDPQTHYWPQSNTKNVDPQTHYWPQSNTQNVDPQTHYWPQSNTQNVDPQAQYWSQSYTQNVDPQTHYWPQSNTQNGLNGDTQAQYWSQTQYQPKSFQVMGHENREPCHVSKYKAGAASDAMRLIPFRPYANPMVVPALRHQGYNQRNNDFHAYADSVYHFGARNVNHLVDQGSTYIQKPVGADIYGGQRSGFLRCSMPGCGDLGANGCVVSSCWRCCRMTGRKCPRHQRNPPF